MQLGRVVVAGAWAALAAHLFVLWRFGNDQPGPVISDLLQFLLGVGATWACFVAANRSEIYARKVWNLAALALLIYTAGQGIVVYYDNVLHAPLFTPWVSDQFLFFWIVPLIIAALIDRWSEQRKIDWAFMLDSAQVFLFALALHLAAFAMAGEWQRAGRDLAFLEWRIRMLRDGVVLVALLYKVFFSSMQKTRSLFLRLGVFFVAYSFADAIYLYAEAAWQNTVGTYLDLLWSVPRVLLIWGALTWQDEPETAAAPVRSRKNTLPLHLASVLGPLFVALIALRIAAESAKLAAVLVSLSFVCASIRFLITQDRQDKAAADLRRSRDLLEAVVEGTTEAVYARDLQGKYIFGNIAARRLLGCSDRELVGRTDDEFFSSESAQRILESDQEVVRTGIPHTIDQTFELNGVPRSFLAKKSPYKDSSGKVAGVLGIALDVTERRKMEEELRKSQRMESIGTLAGGVAHDFNNILTVIKGYSQLLLEQTNGSAREQLGQIDAAADKAATLTRQLLAFSRQQVMQPKVVSLNKIVTDMQKMLRRLIGEDIDFTVELAGGLRSILIDPSQVEQVIMNLAANARDAMPRGGKLTIATSNMEAASEPRLRQFSPVAGDFVMLAVSDSGTGMDAETQAHIFEPFFTTKPPGKGTGLGLSTVYGITKQSGGYILVESEPGKGSTFRMYFPVAEKAAESDAHHEPALPHKEGNETILIVEDESTILKLVESSLRSKGYNVLAAPSGEVAEKIARQHGGPIHLLLSDVVMPQTSGPDLADRITGLRPGIRVLWMSGYTDDTIAHHGILEPGLHFLQKPFTPASLGEKVREVLDKN